MLGALGAGVGAVVDRRNPLEGALLGGVVGLGVGALLGSRSNSPRNPEAERRQAELRRERAAERQRAAELRAKAERDRLVAIEAKLAEARQSIKNKELALAKEQLQAVLALDPPNAEAHSSLARIYEAEGKLLLTIRHLNAYNETARNPAITLKIARLYVQLQQYDDALGKYQALAAGRTEFAAVARKELFMLYCQQGYHREAIRLYPDLSREGKQEQQENYRNSVSAVITEFEQQRFAELSALVDARAKWQSFANGLVQADFLQAERARLGLLLAGNQPRDFLVMNKALLVRYLRVVKSELEPCLCGFFQPKYSKLAQALNLADSHFSEENVSIVDFLKYWSRGHNSLFHILQARVIGESGREAKAYQLLLRELDKYSPGCGAWCDEALHRPEPSAPQQLYQGYGAVDANPPAYNPGANFST